MLAVRRLLSRSSRCFSSSGCGVDIKEGFSGSVGNTPLIRLSKLSKETGCEILGKAEFMNPGGSVKDRAAFFLILDAEKKGLLKAGGTVVEGTAGNTGIGLAHICRARGYRCVIYMPDTQSREKIDLLRMLGAEVRPVPAVPFTDPANFNHQAKAFAEATPNAVWTNQFDNLANTQAHIETTGPEIWRQCGGRLDAFIAASGTGGTLAGVGTYLKSVSPAVKIFIADPPGSVLYNMHKVGRLERSGTGGSITEGIGQGRVTENMGSFFSRLDGALMIPDAKSVEMVYLLLQEEGIFVGASSALNVVAAVELAKQLGPGHTIATIICDTANRYTSRLFSKSWLKSKGLFDAVPAHCVHLVTLD